MNILAQDSDVQTRVEVKERIHKARMKAHERIHQACMEIEERPAKRSEDWKLMMKKFGGLIQCSVAWDWYNQYKIVTIMRMVKLYFVLFGLIKYVLCYFIFKNTYSQIKSPYIFHIVHTSKWSWNKHCKLLHDMPERRQWASAPVGWLAYFYCIFSGRCWQTNPLRLI